MKKIVYLSTISFFLLAISFWGEEENVPPGDIVKVPFLLNGQKISTPDGSPKTYR